MGRNVEHENKIIEEIQQLSVDEPRRKALLAQLFSSAFLTELQQGLAKQLTENKADDAVQFSVLVFIDNPLRYKVKTHSKEGLLGYLFRVATRFGFKRHGRETGLSENAEREVHDTKAVLPCEEVERKELLETLHSLLDDKSRLILGLRLEGHNCLKISEKLGIPKTHVYNLWNNILRIANKLKGD